MERPWRYDFPVRAAMRRRIDDTLPAQDVSSTSHDDGVDADATQAPPFKPNPGAMRIVLRTAGATAVVALMGISGYAAVRGIDLQDWGLAAWGAAQSTPQATRQRLRVQSLDDLRKVTFFDPVNKKAHVFYSIGMGGDIELFNSGGRNPESGEYLKAVTPAIVSQLERRFRQKDQEHAAELERKAATARADAEIARARHAQSASTTQRHDTQVMEATPARTPPVLTARASSPTWLDRPVTQDPDALRATEYNDLVSAARALIDAGRYGEAKIKAQRAIYVDPRRPSARTLWAEAQTRLDQASASASPIPRMRWPY